MESSSSLKTKDKKKKSRTPSRKVILGVALSVLLAFVLSSLIYVALTSVLPMILDKVHAYVMDYFRIKRGSENAPLELPKQLYQDIHEYKSTSNVDDSPKHFKLQYVLDDVDESTYRRNILSLLSKNYQHNSLNLVEVEKEFISATSIKKKRYEHSHTLKYKDLMNNKYSNLKNYYIIQDLSKFKDINNEMKSFMSSLSSKYSGNTLTIEFNIFNSSNTFHQHGASYSYLVKGIKRWFIYSKLPQVGYNPRVNGHTWYNSSYEFLRKGDIHSFTYLFTYLTIHLFIRLQIGCL